MKKGVYQDLEREWRKLKRFRFFYIVLPVFLTMLSVRIIQVYFHLKMEQLKKAIHALHTEGFTVLLDDFGTGYSSLLSLQELEFDILKLDCEFVWGIGEERTEKILEATIELAKSLHMKMIAEGVETEAQHQYLKAHGVSAGQGY